MKEWVKLLIIFLFCMLISIIISITIFQMPDWDFYAYHFYNGWAFLNDRLNIDFMPSMYRSYFNPLLDAFNYIVIMKLNSHPLINHIFFNLNLGIFMFLSYIIADEVIKIQKINKQYLLIFCFVITLLSPVIIRTLSLGYNDIQLASVVLLTIYILIKNLYIKNSAERLFLIFLAGCIIGGGIGLKYSIFSSGLAILLCILLDYKHINKCKQVFFIISAGIFTGLLITDGWWMFALYKQFGNPLFPYFNNIFGSKYAQDSSIIVMDTQYIRMLSLTQFFITPLRNMMKSYVIMEMAFYDLKIPLTYISILLFSVFSILKIKYLPANLYKSLQSKWIDAQKNISNFNILRFIFLFTIAAYSLNSFVFGQIRYVIGIIPLCSILIAIICYIFSYNYFKYFIPLFCAAVLYKHYIFDSKYYLYDKNFDFNINITIIIISIILCLILCLLLKKFKTPKTSLYLSLAVILICCISSVQFNRQAEWINPQKVLEIEKADIEDNSIVLCGTHMSSYIIPMSNKNAKYTAFVLPKELSDKGYWHIYMYSNDYYNDIFIEENLKKLFKQDKNIYFLYAVSHMGEREEEQKDLPLYEQALSIYTEGKINKLDNCKEIKYSVYGYDSAYLPFMICKLK